MISIPQNHTSLRFSCYICHALRTIFLTSDITQGDKWGRTTVAAPHAGGMAIAKDKGHKRIEIWKH